MVIFAGEPHTSLLCLRHTLNRFKHGLSYIIAYSNAASLIFVSAGPEILCGTDNIVISFNRKVVEEENLISDDPGLVSLLSRDSISCTAMFDVFNFTEYYLIVAPSPIDKSCGSYMQVFT